MRAVESLRRLFLSPEQREFLRRRDGESRAYVVEANAYIDRLHADSVYGTLWQLIRDTVGEARFRRCRHGEEEVAAKRLGGVFLNHPDYEVISWRGDLSGTLPGGRILHTESGRTFDVIIFLNLAFDLTERSGDESRWPVV